MPSRPGRMCSVPGCGGLAAAGGSRCAAHGPRESRPSAARRGYGARWRRVRVMFLGSNPVCCDPFGLHSDRVVAATDVDHVVPRALGGGERADNLQSLCHSCHSYKTRRERGMAV